MKRLLLLLVLIAVLLAPLGVAQRESSARAASDQSALQSALASASRYTITDLGTLGGPMNKAMGINENGQAVGASQIGSHTYAFLWDDETMTNLGALGS